MNKCQLEMLELKVCISDDDHETLLHILDEAEAEGLLEHISVQVVRSYTGSDGGGE